jgi:hypothetical protein
VPPAIEKLTFGLLALLLAPPIYAQDQAAFAKWWTPFQGAVARHDAAAIGKGAAFPMNWENGPTRSIKTQADLTSRFDFYITAEIQKIIAAKKPERNPTGNYTITWHARGNEYSLYFKPLGGGVFALDGLSEGPP